MKTQHSFMITFHFFFHVDFMLVTLLGEASSSWSQNKTKSKNKNIFPYYTNVGRATPLQLHGQDREVSRADHAAVRNRPQLLAVAHRLAALEAAAHDLLQRWRAVPSHLRVLWVPRDAHAAVRVTLYAARARRVRALGRALAGKLQVGRVAAVARVAIVFHVVVVLGAARRALLSSQPTRSGCATAYRSNSAGRTPGCPRSCGSASPATRYLAPRRPAHHCR